MNPNASKSWRADGDAEAFDHSAWELKAQQFSYSAKRMLDLIEKDLGKLATDIFMLPFVAEFLISLGIELISKAFYLKVLVGPKEKIYTHTLHDLGIDPYLNADQIHLIRHAERYVVWAGRYPTPKWTKEASKEEWDVPSVIEHGIEKINGEDIPNTASIPRIKAKIDLYALIWTLWDEAAESAKP